MCVLCSQLWVEEHWSDVSLAETESTGSVVALETHVAQRGQRLRDRAAQARLFDRILSCRGLTLQDWEGSSFILRDAKGRSEVVANLAQVWQRVERMTGAALDPLDPEVIVAIRAAAES